jgi:hypothetical protein
MIGPRSLAPYTQQGTHPQTQQNPSQSQLNLHKLSMCQKKGNAPDKRAPAVLRRQQETHQAKLDDIAFRGREEEALLMAFRCTVGGFIRTAERVSF